MRDLGIEGLRMNDNRIVHAKDVEAKIEEQQRDLCETITRLIALRNEKFNGFVELKLVDGRVVDVDLITGGRGRQG